MNNRSAELLKYLGLVALASPIVLLGVLRAVPAWDPLIMAFDFHFYVVSLTAIAAALACGVLIASAKTLRHTRLLFLGLGFFAIAGIFAVHGLATPGVFMEGYYGSVGVSAWLSAAAGAALIAVSVVGLPKGLDRLVGRNGQTIFAAAAVGIGAYIGLSLAVQTWLDWVPIGDAWLQWSLGLGALALTGFAAWRYYQSYLFAKLPSQIAMVATLALLMEVQAIILWGRVWHLSWWLYHGLYGAAFVALFAGWWMETRRAGTLRAIADALSMRDALAQLDRGLDAPIVELVDAVEAKDVETFGHVRRVSSYSLRIAKHLGLSSAKLRAVALAAEMHDVGKISVPSSILSKPAALTDEEFAVVKAHTTRGAEIASQVPALRELTGAIRAHHERLNGSGYPDGLAGDDIPLVARIIAVADTYDAITSKRPYREGRSHEEAIAEITRLRGIEFDERCVDAFVTVFDDAGSDDDERAAA